MKLGLCIVSARESVGVTQRELANRCGIKPSEICQIENERVVPRFDRVERFASALGMSVVDLLSFAQGESCVREDPKRKSTCDHVPTTVGIVGASAAVSLVAESDLKETAEHPRRIHPTQLIFPKNRNGLDGAAVSLAAKMRSALGLGLLSNADLEDLLLMRGVRVFRAMLPARTQSVGIWSARRRRLSVVLNETNTAERDRFRLAFELAVAHVYSATKSAVDVNHVINHRFLKEFASSFLMPAESVRQLVESRGVTPSTWTFDMLIALKSRFGVSAESFALRLDELGLIDNTLRLTFRAKLHDYYKNNPKAMEPNIALTHHDSI